MGIKKLIIIALLILTVCFTACSGSSNKDDNGYISSSLASSLSQTTSSQSQEMTSSEETSSAESSSIVTELSSESSSEVSSESFSKSTSQSLQQSSVLEKEYTLKGKVFNVIKGNLQGVTISAGNYSTQTDANGNFSLTFKGEEVTVSKSGYETQNVLVKDVFNTNDTVVETSVELVKSFATVGYAERIENLSGFTLKVSRSSKGIILQLTTTNTDWYSSTNNNNFEIYFSTQLNNTVLGKTNFRLRHECNGFYAIFSYDPNFTYDWITFDTKDVLYNKYEKDGQLYIEFTVPFKKFGLTATSVYGLSFIERLGDTNTVSKLINTTDGTIVSTDNPTDYVRTDKNNSVYDNASNVELNGGN